MMVLQHILAMLCEMFHMTPIMTNGYKEEDPLHDLHAHQFSVLWIFYLQGHLRQQLLVHREANFVFTGPFQELNCRTLYAS
jgi:hypothetical protein